MNQLSVKILTPAGPSFEGESSMVVLSSEDGEMGILPDHISMIFKIAPGLIKLYSGGRVTEELFAFGGFGKVHDNELFVLVDKVSSVKDLDASQAQKDLSELERQVMSSGDEKILSSIASKARLAQTIIDVSQHKR
jgi:F-type H+-transporting ATPase subunit epsilon